jgi:anaerobic magnesium-protoporphyrin IX monomethyl ester cyclase
MSRVLVGHSYFLRFDPKLWRAMQPYPPLGTLYAAALLREAGHEVRLFDAMLAESTQEWDAMLREGEPDVAVLFEDNFNYLSKMCLLNMREAAFEMIGAAKARGCTVVVAGADVTDHAQEYIERGADFAVLGEGDETVVELVAALEAGRRDFEAIPGLVFRDRRGTTPPPNPLPAGGEGEPRSVRPELVEGRGTHDDARRPDLVNTGQRPVMRDLGALPAPARDLIDLGHYRAAWQRHGRFSMNLVTSRGCSFHCNWCAKPIWGQRYNVRSPESVVDEIEMLHSKGAEHLWFMDDILGIKPGWLNRFADLIEERGLQTPFKCLSRADLLLRPGEIEALARAGCESVWIGAESGSQKVLDAMEKGTTVEQVREAARRLKEVGIRPAFFLQFGYPGEDWEDVQATLQLVRDCDPDDIGMSVSYPLPGTPFYERVKDSMSDRGNWIDSEDMPMLYDGPYSTGFYHRVFDALHAEFRIRKATRGRPFVPVAIGLARRGRVKGALSLLRDATLLPVHRMRMQRERRRSRRNENTLPVALSRVEAGTPTRQDEPHPPAPSPSGGEGEPRAERLEVVDGRGLNPPPGPLPPSTSSRRGAGGEGKPNSVRPELVEGRGVRANPRPPPKAEREGAP